MSTSFSELCDAVGASLEKEKEDLKQQELKLQSDREQLETEKNAMSNYINSNDDDIIELNVGGTHFTVYRSTLLQAPEGTMFNAMFSGRWDESLTKDAKERIFLDMTPSVFSVILSHLRTLKEYSSILKNAPKQQIDIMCIDKKFRNELRARCEFYGLISAVSPIFLDIRAQEPGRFTIEDTNGNEIIITRQSGPSSHSVIYGKEPFDTNNSYWKISVEKLKSWVFAGIIANSNPEYNSHADKTCFGWASNNQTYVNGVHISVIDNWGGWKVGDKAIFKLCSKSLKMYSFRLKKVFSITIPESTTQNTWRLNLNMYNQDDCIRITNPDPEEMCLVD